MVVAVAGWYVADIDAMRTQVKLATALLKDGETFTVTFRRDDDDDDGNMLNDAYTEMAMAVKRTTMVICIYISFFVLV
jgi:hypothetical protein